MAKPRPAQPVKLLCGVLGSDLDLIRRARFLLAKQLGAIDIESDVWVFDQTDYYAEEMGRDLKRVFYTFDSLIPADGLAAVKHETNAIEAQIADDCAALEITRPINLDPGYIDSGKLVLATTKDRSHRLYIGSNMYAEVTLHYVRGEWRTSPWTYPDYQQPKYHAFFHRVRDALREQRRRLDVFSPDAET